jgi:hypothetical protein
MNSKVDCGHKDKSYNYRTLEETPGVNMAFLTLGVSVVNTRPIAQAKRGNE